MKKVILLIVCLVMFVGCAYNNLDNENDNNKYSIKEDDEKYLAVSSSFLTDIFEDEQLKKDRLSQLFYLEPVIVLENKRDSMYIQTKDGIKGYIDKRNTSPNLEVLKSDEIKTIVTITASKKMIYLDTKGKVPYKEVVLGTTFYLRKLHGDWLEITLDNNESGYLTIANVIMYNTNIPLKTNLESFIRNILGFNNTRYVKGGISQVYGADMKNAVYISALLNGMNLKRDLTDIEKYEVFADPENLKTGDILFIAKDRYSNEYSKIAVCVSEDAVLMHDDENNKISKVRMIEVDLKNRIRKVFRIFNE